MALRTSGCPRLSSRTDRGQKRKFVWLISMSSGHCKPSLELRATSGRDTSPGVDEQGLSAAVTFADRGTQLVVAVDEGDRLICSCSQIVVVKGLHNLLRSDGA